MVFGKSKVIDKYCNLLQAYIFSILTLEDLDPTEQKQLLYILA